MIFRLLAFLALASTVPGEVVPVEGRERTWDSRNFRLVSEIELPPADLKRLATVADATARAVASHPIGFFDDPGDSRPELRICADAERYRSAGGLAGTAGWYLWKKRAVVLDAEHLFPERAGSSIRAMPDEAIVVHEIVHLCMHRSQGRMPQWLSEGICEYFAAAHEGGGRFRLDDMDRRIREHLKSRFGERPEGIPLLPFSSITGHDHREWTDFLLRLPAERRYEGYSSALLLAHYHLHAPARRDFLKIAFGSRPPKVGTELDLDEPSSREIQTAITRFWKPKGLTLHFTEPPPAADGGR